MFAKNEDKIINEITEYIASTYSAHYVNDKNIQVTDIWESMGMAKEAYRTNMVKYIIGAGNKGDQERKDIMKIIHYAILYLNELEKKNEYD